jgi:hypothetical protein
MLLMAGIGDFVLRLNLLSERGAGMQVMSSSVCSSSGKRNADKRKRQENLGRHREPSTFSNFMQSDNDLICC